MVRRRGSSMAGVAVSSESAMRHSVVWSCVDHHASTISTMPLDVYRRTPDGRVELPTPALFERPEPERSLTEWLWAVQASVELHGNAFALKVYGSGGRVESAILLDPVKVSAWRERSGLVRFQIDGREVAAADMWHFRAKVLAGKVLGLSTLSAAREAVGMGAAVEAYLARWFGDGAHPSAVWETDRAVNKEQAQTIKDRIMAATADNREPLVVGMGLKYKQMQMSPADSAFLDVANLNATDLCRFFDVYPETISVSPPGGTSLTYSNRQDRAIDQLAYKTGPRLARLEEALTSLLPRGEFAKFNVDALLRTDLASRYAAHERAIRIGMASVNERRALEDMPPVADGDRMLWPPYSLLLETEEAPDAPA